MLQKIRSHHNLKSIFNDFAEKMELVYFGKILDKDEVVRHKGVTFSPRALDSHFVHGTSKGYDASALLRETQAVSQIRDSQRSQWTVVVISLKSDGLPHIILDNNKHTKLMQKGLYLRYPKLRTINELLRQLNPSASQIFDMYMQADQMLLAPQLLSDEILQRVAMNYAKYSVELQNRELFILRQGAPRSSHELTDMLEEAIWLAERLETRHSYQSAAQIDEHQSPLI